MPSAATTVPTTDRVTIKPNLTRLFATMALSAAGMTIGLAGMLIGLFGWRWLNGNGWMVLAAIGAVVVSIVAIAVGIAATQRRPRIEIGPDGFSYYPLFGSRTRRWWDIVGDFTTVKIGRQSAHVYQLNEACKQKEGIKSGKFPTKADEAISGSYEMPTADVAALMNQYKRRAGVS